MQDFCNVIIFIWNTEPLQQIISGIVLVFYLVFKMLAHAHWKFCVHILFTFGQPQAHYYMSFNFLTLWNRRLWNGYIKEKKRKWFSRSTFVFNSSFCESHRINQLNFLKHMSAFQQGDSSSEHWLGGSVVVITALIPLHWYRWFTFQTCIMGNTSASSASRSRHISGDETGPSLTAGRFLSDSNSSTQDTYEALIKSGYRVIFSVAMLPSFCQHITLLYWQFGGKYVNNNNFKVTNVNLFTILLPSCLQICWCWTNTAMK